jgi:sulfate transport system ATP-binding protein
VRPRVLLLDEPFGALDAKVRKELRRWLRRLHDELHITSLFVTHDQDEAIELADRLVLMNKGKVEQTGSVREVYSKPATPFVYSFLGAVNRFTGRVDGDYLRVNGNVMPIAGGGGANGREVVAFARPHELDIVAGDRNDTVGVPATVSRILDVGAVARVELSAPATHTNGAGKPAEPQFFEVELSAQKLSELNLAAGQPVRLVSSRLRVFEQGAQT